MKRIVSIIIFSLIALIGISQVPAIIIDDQGNVIIGNTLSVQENHGSFGFQDSAFIVLCTQNNYSHMTNVNNDLIQVQDADGVTILNDTLITPVTGHWTITGGASFQGSVNDVWHIAIFVNGVQEGFNMPRKTSNNDTGAFPFGGSLDLTAGDEITIEVMNSANSNDYTAVSLFVIITFLHF